VRTAPARARDFVDDRMLPLFERRRIVETLDLLGAIRLDDAKLESTSGNREHLALKKLSLALEPPEHGADSSKAT
jgi:hypothetical protein